MVTDDVFAVIAEATRRDILASLRDGDKAVGELVRELEASQPTISKHLKVLREADLVSMRAQGQKRYYALNPKPLAGVASWLEAFDVGSAASATGVEAPAEPAPAGEALAAMASSPGTPATGTSAPGTSAARYFSSRYFSTSAGRAGGSRRGTGCPSRREPAEPRRGYPGGRGRRGQDAAADRPHRRPRRHQGRGPAGQPA